MKKGIQDNGLEDGWGGEVGITAVSRGGLGGLSMAGTWREVTL